MTTLLELNNFCFGFSEQKLLISGLSLKIYAGSITIISGPNGIGKSTLLKGLAGLPFVYTNGNVEFSPYIHTSPAYIPQNYESHIHLPLSLGDILRSGSNGRPLEEINMFGLLEEKDLGVAWQTASGGEKQKTIFIRFLNQNPQILLLDEPTNHLDPKSVKQLWQELENYISESGKNRAAIVVSHTEELPEFSLIQQHTLDLKPYSLRSQSHSTGEGI